MRDTYGGITIYVSKDGLETWRQAEEYAHQHGSNLNVLSELALREYLDRHPINLCPACHRAVDPLSDGSN